MSKYTDLRDFYVDELARVEKRADDWRDKAISRGDELRRIQGKIEIYELLFSKFIKDPTSNDEVFIFNNKVYVPVKHTLSNNLGELETLDVTFIERVIDDANTNR